jgi:biotin carboxyl carrier protein
MAQTYEAKVNDDQTLEIASENGHFLLDGKAPAEFHVTGPHSFQVVQGGRNFRVHVVSVDTPSQTVVLKVNGKRAEVKLTTEIDRMLQRLGIHAKAGARAGDVRAPMPGQIMSVLVEPGQAVEKGEPLLVLVAMKMENVIKATASGTVAKVLAQPGENVQKGQALLLMA